MDPKVARYRALLEAPRLQEPLLRVPRRLNELELQARWFAGGWGRDFRALTGEAVRIVQFGVWNREAGPDFAEAAVTIAGGEPRRGAVELDVDVRDWERHGHATNPAFDGVVLHVFLERGAAESFTRTSRHGAVCQVQLDPALLADEPPQPVPLAKPGRCLAPLRALAAEEAQSVIEAAARHRTERKARRLLLAIDSQGWDQAVYEAVAAALGYKQNEMPFRLLAQRFPWRQLQSDRANLSATLFGGAGFLPAADRREFPPETREYLRGLWERWWALRAEFAELTLPAELWKLGGQRPLNHPQRRVAALARLAETWRTFAPLARAADVAKLQEFCARLSDPYWDWHYTLSSKKAPARMALLGETRVAEILANVLFPLALEENPERWAEYQQLPAALSNRRVETAATRLFGAGPERRPFLRRAVHQQGLLQIYEDFCMRDDSDCDRCLFPSQLARWPAT